VRTSGPLDGDGVGGGGEEKQLGQELEDHTVAAVALPDGVEHDVDAVRQVFLAQGVQLSQQGTTWRVNSLAKGVAPASHDGRPRMHLRQEKSDERLGVALGAVVRT